MKTRRVMGKTSGATEHEDGAIDLAPMWVEEFRSLNRREAALLEMYAATQKTVASGLEQIRRDTERVWERLCLDLELDFNVFSMLIRLTPNGARC